MGSWDIIAAPEAEIPIQNKSAVVLDRSIMHLGYAIYLPNTYTYKHTHVHILMSSKSNDNNNVVHFVLHNGLAMGRILHEFISKVRR